MSEQVPVTRTVITLRDYARAVLLKWGGGLRPSKATVAVLWAQYCIETGGTACWNFNVGNVKSHAGDGYDFHCLRGVWEGVSPAEAERLIASGEARRDPSADHAKAVDPKAEGKRVSVVFEPPHPQTRFRAFYSLEEAMGDHLALLQKRFAGAWGAVLAGDYKLFAQQLKARGYFTASAEAYANGMRRAYEDFLMSAGYEDALEVLAQADATPTLPALPSEEETGSGGIVHAMPDTVGPAQDRDE